MARSFNGTSDNIAFVTDVNLPLSTSDRSVFCWINCGPSSGGGYTTLFEYGQNTPNAGVFWYLHGSVLALDSFNTVWDATVNVASNTWRAVGWTYSSPTSIMYVDGVQDSTNAGNGFSTVSIPANCHIGTDFLNRYYAGQMAELAVWNVKLTAAEMAALAKGARPNTIRPSALKAWWPLGGIQSPEPDLSGLANNGTLTGTNPAFGPPVMQFTPMWPQTLAGPSPSPILSPAMVTSHFTRRPSVVGY
jgi:hypothetical protein